MGAVINATLHHLGFVSSESGPLLLVDVEDLEHWGGTARGDYERICHWLDDRPGLPGYETEVGAKRGLVWELGGPGTSDVFRRSPHDLLLCRAWVESISQDAAERRPQEADRFGAITVRSGWLLAFWPTASGAEIELPDTPSDGQQVEVSGVADAGLLVSLEPGAYFAWWDVADAAADVRRCWILREGEAPQ